MTASALASLICDQLDSILKDQNLTLSLLANVREDVSQFGEKLRSIQSVLQDVEERQIGSHAVKEWLHRLKETFYNIEDVLDELNTAMLNHHHQKKKVCFSFPSPCVCFNDQVVFQRHISGWTKDIKKDLDHIIREKDMFNFSSISSVESSARRIPTVPLVNEAEMYGRDEEKETLVSMLLSDSSEKGRDLPIFSIVGMGGIGKTTLAQLVYNDVRVAGYFDLRMWSCVSKDFNVLKIANSILESLQLNFLNSDDLQYTLERLRESIVGKKFFLVLDDVWTEDYMEWELLLSCLSNGLHGSKILITTRNESVARMLESVNIICIRGLPEDISWSLFCELAFSNRTATECEALEEIGRKIFKRCKGLPLAIKTIGSVLRFKRSKHDWQLILESIMGELEGFDRSIFEILFLSYRYLPSKVKPCLLYCSIFPEDHTINKDELIKLWMAQGYLGIGKNIGMEAVGEEIFDTLKDASFIQELESDDDGSIIRCKMHDIVHEFVQLLTEKECETIKVYGVLEEPRINWKPHHLTLKLFEGVSFPDTVLKYQRLRSLVLQYGVSNCLSINEVLPKLFNELTSLRALNLSGQLWYENVIILIPKEIGKLIHLKYLNLSSLKIDELPEELCDLQNLQTLELSWCSNLKKLPQGVGKLINLRHLVNDGTSLSYMPKGIEKLTCLRTLSEFVEGAGADGGEGCALECLRNLQFLGGSLSIKKLGTVSDASTVKKPKLENKGALIRLCLDFENDEEEMMMNELEKSMKIGKHEAILEALQSQPNLEFLEIKGYKGKTFPDWIMSLSKLRTLNFHNCTNIVQLPPLGKIPSLESLSICSMWSVKSVGNEFLGITSDGASSSSSVVAFPKLKSLKFVDMEEWQDWDCGTTIMPCLHFLSFVHCPELRVLPDQILQTEKLQELNINWCSILKKRYSGQTREGWHKISHIPNIMINFEYVQGNGH